MLSATEICRTLLVDLGTLAGTLAHPWASAAARKRKIPRKSSCGEVAEWPKAAVC
jgi:hypothetical protein